MTAGRVLFTATHRGQPVTVRHAGADELTALAGPVDPASARDTLDAWSLVAIRNTEAGVGDVRALGWRVALLNSWITSPLVAVDAAPCSPFPGTPTRSGGPTARSCILTCANISPMRCGPGDTRMCTDERRAAVPRQVRHDRSPTACPTPGQMLPCREHFIGAKFATSAALHTARAVPSDGLFGGWSRSHAAGPPWLAFSRRSADTQPSS